jgi:hypothetical protein
MDEESQCPYKKDQVIRETNDEIEKCPFNNKMENQNDNLDIDKCPYGDQAIPADGKDEDSDQENVSTGGCPFIDNSTCY